MSGLLGRLMIRGARLYPSLLFTLRNASKNERNLTSQLAATQLLKYAVQNRGCLDH